MTPIEELWRRALQPVTPEEYFGSAVDVRRLPLGMRLSNNPGNIKWTGSRWQRANFPGLVGPSSARDQGDPQAYFTSPLAGMAASVRLADAKYRQGMNTVRNLIAGRNGWTPGFTGAAVNVARQMGVGVDDPIDLSDPATMARFQRALITQEHGDSARLYPDTMIQEAVTLARAGAAPFQPVAQTGTGSPPKAVAAQARSPAPAPTQTAPAATPGPATTASAPPPAPAAMPVIDFTALLQAVTPPAGNHASATVPVPGAPEREQQEDPGAKLLPYLMRQEEARRRWAASSPLLLYNNPFMPAAGA